MSSNIPALASRLAGKVPVSQELLSHWKFMIMSLDKNHKYSDIQKVPSISWPSTIIGLQPSSWQMHSFRWFSLPRYMCVLSLMHIAAQFNHYEIEKRIQQQCKIVILGSVAFNIYFVSSQQTHFLASSKVVHLQWIVWHEVQLDDVSKIY